MAGPNAQANLCVATTLGTGGRCSKVFVVQTVTLLKSFFIVIVSNCERVFKIHYCMEAKSYLDRRYGRC